MKMSALTVEVCDLITASVFLLVWDLVKWVKVHSYSPCCASADKSFHFNLLMPNDGIKNKPCTPLSKTCGRCEIIKSLFMGKIAIHWDKICDCASGDGPVFNLLFWILFLALSQEENAMGRFLKSQSNHDKTRAGKMMAAVGKAQTFSSEQRLVITVP